MRLRDRKLSILRADYLAHRYLWRNIEAAVTRARSKLPAEGLVVVDVGCGQKPYADLFSDCIYFGVNYSAGDAAPDVVGDAMCLPIASRCADLVFCSQVLEHVPRPWNLIEECFRILKQHGWLVLSAPFYWPLHEEPNDYFRFTRYGLDALLRSAGFEDVELHEDGGDFARLSLSVIHALPFVTGRILRVPLNIFGLVFDRVFHSTTLPANYTVIARASPRRGR